MTEFNMPLFTRGSNLKLVKQMMWTSPIFHIRQIFKNAKNPMFWKYGFRKHPAVKRKKLKYWKWVSLNRDLFGNECPGWQWWYYELEHYIKTPRGVQKMSLLNYRKFPIIHSALDLKFQHNGRFYTIYLTPEEARDSKEIIQD
jgi:hypothetical protein|tara:strand:+ start:5836 stop:6264 length:429 start_codon:yes stop_codon:yes gene_type:complete